MATEDEESELAYAPDMIPDVGDRVFCFIDHGRVCGPDCLGFMTHKADMKNTELDDNQRHCILLVNSDRLARHAVVIASLFATVEKKKRTEAQDRRRVENTPKPGPFAAPAPVSPFPVERP